jgi:hypothetical protein
MGIVEATTKPSRPKFYETWRKTSAVRSWLSLVQSPNSESSCLPFRSSVFERAALKGKRWLTLLATQLRLYRESFGRENLVNQYAQRLGKLPMRRVPTASLHFGASLIDAVRHALNDVSSTSIGSGGTKYGLMSPRKRCSQHPSTWAFFL